MTHKFWQIDGSRSSDIWGRKPCKSRFSFACLLIAYATASSPQVLYAAKPDATVRAAVAADARFPSSLYTPEFTNMRLRASALDGLSAEGGLTGEAGIGRIEIRSMRTSGKRILVKIASRRDGGAPLEKTITFFMATSGRIADVDTNTLGKLSARGPMQHMPTLLARYRSILADRNK